MKTQLLIIWLLVGGLAGCPQSTDRPIDSIISVGMPFRAVSRSLEREGLEEYVVSLPRDSQDLKRYRFSHSHTLVLLLKSASLHEGSDIAPGPLPLAPSI